METAQPPAYEKDKIAEQRHDPMFEEEGGLKQGEVSDAFGNEEYAEIKYKTLKWWYVSTGRNGRRKTFTHSIQAMWSSDDLRVRLAWCSVSS